MTYFESVKGQLKNPKVAILAVIFTVARIIYGWSWVQSGWGKLAWFSDDKLNSAGKIQVMVKNLAGPEVTKFDPLGINKAWAWVADNIFLGMPGVTDILVVSLEILAGLAIVFGFRVFWAALTMMLMNVQFMAGASFNNFGYIWTNLALMKFACYAELIGVDGFLKFKKERH